MFKRCLMCRKVVFKKYDVIKYMALDTNDNVKEFSAYLHKKCADEIDDETRQEIESLRIRERPDFDEEGPDTL